MKRRFLFIPAFVLAAIGFSAFKLANPAEVSATSESARQATTWYYNSSVNSESAFKNAANWTQSDLSGQCGSGPLPCRINAEAEDQSQLQDFFTDMGSSSVLSIADGTKQ